MSEQNSAGPIPEMSAEQGADFAALMAGADAPAAAADAKATEQATGDMQAMLAANVQMIEFAWDLIGGLLPEKVAERYGPEQRQRIAETGTALAIEQQWSVAEFMSKWGVKVAFAGALIGPAVPVIIEAIKSGKKPKQDTAKQVQIEPPQQAQADQTPGAKTVTMGTVLS